MPPGGCWPSPAADGSGGGAPGDVGADKALGLDDGLGQGEVFASDELGQREVLRSDDGG